VFVALILVLPSCSRKVVTVVERHDSIHVQQVRDTLRLTERDSVIIQTKGDTVFVEKFKLRYRERVTERVDTIKDVTQIPVIQEVPIEKPYPFKDKLLLVGIGFAIAIVLGIVLAVVSVFRKV
jgi:hypothetical protein